MAPTHRRQFRCWNLCAAAGWPERRLCDGGRAAARRQNDENDALELRRALGWLLEVDNACRCDGDRGSARTFQLANDRRTDRAAVVAFRPDVQVCRRNRHEKHKRERRYARNDRTVERRWQFRSASHLQRDPAMRGDHPDLSIVMLFGKKRNWLNWPRAVSAVQALARRKVPSQFFNHRDLLPFLGLGAVVRQGSATPPADGASAHQRSPKSQPGLVRIPVWTPRCSHHAVGCGSRSRGSGAAGRAQPNPGSNRAALYLRSSKDRVGDSRVLLNPRAIDRWV
jgi:hypothetical protein